MDPSKDGGVDEQSINVEGVAAEPNGQTDSLVLKPIENNGTIP